MQDMEVSTLTMLSNYQVSVCVSVCVCATSTQSHNVLLTVPATKYGWLKSEVKDARGERAGFSQGG